MPEPMEVDAIMKLAEETGTYPFTCYDNGFSVIAYDSIGWMRLRQLDRQRNIYLMQQKPATEVSGS